MADDKVNILMVDDQPGKLLSYEVILGELGENLLKATSGKEALELLLKHEVAVVLMDVSMPELDGFELASLIHQHPRFQRTAIIFISAVHLTDLDRLQGYQRGAVDYISVPVVPELLRAKVSVFAELHRKARQLQVLNSELEQRVQTRTEELDQKAETLQRLNDELAHKHQELDALVRTAPDFIFSHRAEGARDYNSERFYEYTGAPVGAANDSGWLDYVHPDDKDQAVQMWRESTQSGRNYEAEYRLRDHQGNYRWFRARALPIRDSKGEVLKWYGNCSDIHDSKLLEQSIRDSAHKLEQMVDDRTAALRRLSSRLMTMQDEERRRIARELHDGLGQELAVAKMMLDGFVQQDLPPVKKQATADVVTIIDRALQHVRSMSHLLHPPLLDEVGLLSALQWYLDGLMKRSGIRTSIEVEPGNFPRLPQDVETAIFRIIQEALINMYRHSEASKGVVTVAQRDHHVVVTVRDDGKGIGPQVADLKPGSIGIGIGGMSQRAKELGGEFRMSNANPGTLVEVTIPCTIPSPEEAGVV